MNEYQISVSANGIFMFRTEWDQNKERVVNAAVTIKSSMPSAVVRVNARDNSYTSSEVK
jgi:hypothetical protein